MAAESALNLGFRNLIITASMAENLIIDDVSCYFPDLDVVSLVKQLYPIGIPRGQRSPKHFYNEMVLANVLLSIAATGFVCATRIALVIWCLDDVGALFLTDELASSDDEDGDDERSRHRSNYDSTKVYFAYFGFYSRINPGKRKI